MDAQAHQKLARCQTARPSALLGLDLALRRARGLVTAQGAAKAYVAIKCMQSMRVWTRMTARRGPEEENHTEAVPSARAVPAIAALGSAAAAAVAPPLAAAARAGRAIACELQTLLVLVHHDELAPRQQRHCERNGEREKGRGSRSCGALREERRVV